MLVTVLSGLLGLAAILVYALGAALQRMTEEVSHLRDENHALRHHHPRRGLREAE